MSREQRLAETFVELADTLVDDFDVIEFLQVLASRCVELLDVTAAGLVLADHDGSLRLMAASDERARLLELFEVQNDEGPCRDCFRLGEAVVNVNLDGARSRWPRFAAQAIAGGFYCANALPLRLRHQVVGSLNLFHTELSGLAHHELRLAQALADAATIGILQQRTIRQGEIVAGQLQAALTSRVIIEQAKGVVAERLQVSTDEAFGILRATARSHNRLLSDVARDVTSGTADVAQLLRPVRGAEPNQARRARPSRPRAARGQPDAGSPRPDAGSPRPDAGSPGPDAGSPGPDAGSPSA
jgi:transcriptional regulator with GAF, ATPase, and Fis domain